MRNLHGNPVNLPALELGNRMLRFLRKIFGAKAPAGSGEAGEKLAAEWLQRERRFSLVARNWRSPRDRRDEIDLICRDGDVLVFVEVKTRTAAALVPGFHAIDARKKRVLRRAARIYLGLLRERPRTFRFDVVEVALPGAPLASAGERADGLHSRPAAAPEILHFENVPLFPKFFQ